MVNPVFLPALLLASAWAEQPPPATLDIIASLVSRSFLSQQKKLDTLLADDTCELSNIRIELIWEAVQSVLNATSQLQEDNELLRGRQAASAAVQATQLLILAVYFVTIFSIYLVKRCQEAREKSQQKDFELLEKQLRQRRHQRRTAAAKEKSTPAASLE
jgi:hypothetical protein